MEADDLVEECSSDGHVSIGVAKCNEVGVVREAVDDCNHNGLAVHPRKTFDETIGMSDQTGGNVEWLQQDGRMEMLGLVALVGLAPLTSLLACGL